MYTDDKNAQVVLSLLKQYGVKKIVISPGTTNVPISRSVQLDPWFEVYSVVDERSAAYFAGGLAFASGEPVVISCTGATASRNYLPGLTEAYYRNLPVIALTSQHHVNDFGSLVPQVTDRTASQNDVKRISVHLPYIKDDEDYERCIILANRALIAATTRGNGPVHINLHVTGDYRFTTDELPVARKISHYNTAQFATVTKELNREIGTRKLAIFVGAHRKFTSEEADALGTFATKYKAPVFVDHTSSYTGKNAVLVAQIADLRRSSQRPDLIIDLGSVTGEYSADWLRGIETWRLSEDGDIHDRFNNQTKLFDGREEDFFSAFRSVQPSVRRSDYHGSIKKEVSGIEVLEADMAISNTYVSYRLAQKLPAGANLHMGILNSLRNMNFYPFKQPNIDASSNVGGFGIDGALSTLIGQSMHDRNQLNFGLLGDLATFYDMNALSIRHIKNNVRILMVNNNGGVEFRLNSKLETQWADETGEFISAAGHRGSMRGWAESAGFVYMAAASKDEFDQKIDDFCAHDRNAFDRPVFFEVFTTVPDEQTSIAKLQAHNKSPEPTVEAPRQASKVKKALKKVAPTPIKKAYKRLRSRG